MTFKNNPADYRKQATVYIGVVGPETENGQCVETIWTMNRRDGDSTPQFIRATKGFEARGLHIGKFLESPHGAILLLDSDMFFQKNTLDELRKWGMAYISGYYMRRTYQPIAPVMFEYNKHDLWPVEPMSDDPSPGALKRIGASGWGCVLIHREVFQAVDPLLKGEPYVIEDDMDVHPYDLDVMLRLIGILNRSNDLKLLKKAAAALKHEFRPLRGLKDNVGSDVRFPYFAKQAGYDLFLDPGVRPGHNINYFVTGDDYTEALKAVNPDPDKRITYGDIVDDAVTRERQNWLKHMDMLKGLVENGKTKNEN